MEHTCQKSGNQKSGIQPHHIAAAGFITTSAVLALLAIAIALTWQGVEDPTWRNIILIVLLVVAIIVVLALLWALFRSFAR